MKVDRVSSNSLATSGEAPRARTANKPSADPLTGLPVRSTGEGPRPSTLAHPKRALGVLSFPCEVSAARLRNQAQLAVESNDVHAVAFCLLQARHLEGAEIKSAKWTVAMSVAVPALALGLLPMAGTIGRHRKTETLCLAFLSGTCSTDELAALSAMNPKDKNIADQIRAALPHHSSTYLT